MQCDGHHYVAAHYLCDCEKVSKVSALLQCRQLRSYVSVHTAATHTRVHQPTVRSRAQHGSLRVCLVYILLYIVSIRYPYL